MFSNVGRKIQALVKVIVWIMIVGYVIGGFVVMFSGSVPVYDELGYPVVDEYGYQETQRVATFGSVMKGIAIMALGFVLSWVSSFFFYGFGKIVEWVEHPYVGRGDGEPSCMPEEERFFKQGLEKMKARQAKKAEERRVLDEYYAQKETHDRDVQEAANDTPKYKCPKCGEMVEQGTERCPVCNQKFRWA